MTNYQRLNNIVGWLTFSIAAFTYCSTIEPTASFWDCGEYIATAFKLEVGHPPGAPLFQMIGRFFSLFAFGDVTKVAMMVNIMSALCSAFTILFLFWTITALMKKMVIASGKALTDGTIYAILGSGLVGGLAYTFSDSFWFSAVEGEVYAMSSFFTAIVFWAILKWETLADEPGSDRWLILIACLVGLSIGVHLLNLLTVPAIVFIYYFKKYNVTRNGIIITSILSVFLLGGIQSVLIPGIANLAANFELKFVNGFGLPFNSGTIFYFLLLVSIVVVGVLYSHKPNDNRLFSILMAVSGLFFLLAVISSKSGSAAILRLVLGLTFFGLFFYMKKNGGFATLNTILLCFAVLLIGYSTFFVLIIRSQANPPIDENNPENAISMLSYLNREQYGDFPLVFGPYYNSLLDPNEPFKDGEPVYMKEEENSGIQVGADGIANTPKRKDRYVISDDRKSATPNYNKELCTPFPRMWSTQDNHEAAYKNWAEIKGNPVQAYNIYTGENETVIKPTFWENLRYFRKYQVGHMYLRYFLWNFVGRQNDVQGHGNVTDGNWLSGINLIDEMFLGAQDRLPESMANNKARNVFYGLPLLLGMIGLFFHFNRANKDALVVLLLFVFTGLAIVLYLNQYPYQPRERDYAYAASFYVFAIWIGIGVYALFDALREKLSDKLNAIVTTAVCLVAVPTIMAKEGWDDHDRSNRYTARDFAINYLNSCAPNAVLFTNGDNDTFPLWYVQEVEGVRTDVRVINLSLLNTDWYIDQMKRKAYLSDPVPFSLSNDKYRQGTRDYLRVMNKGIKGHIKLRELIDFIASEDPKAKEEMGDGKGANYFPTNNMTITVDTEKVVANGTVPKSMQNRILHSIDWTLNKRIVMKNDLMVLDLLATNDWERPIYFAVTTGPDSYMDLQDYFQLEGLAYRLVPVKATEDEKQVSGTRVATDVMYDNVMNKFKWGNVETPGVYLDENISRMTMNMRIQMSALATALVEEGKKDSAIAVLDKCMKMLPEVNVPYEPTLYNIAVAYYQAGAIEQPNKICKRLFEVSEQDFHFRRSINDVSSRDFKQAAGMMERIAYLVKSFKQAALAKELESRLTSVTGASLPQEPAPEQP